MTIALIVESRDRNVIAATEDQLVRDVLVMLAEKRIGALPVMRGSEIAGIFSERDVVRNLHAIGGEILDRPVGELMTAPAVTVSSDTDVVDALSLMTNRRIRHLPVVEDGKMIDFVSIGDLVKHRIDTIQGEAEAMREYIMTA